MKTKILLAAVLAFCIFNFSFTAPAATTINAANHYAYAANLGWVDARGDVTSGAVIGEFVCSGSLYAANVGWISLGGGAPTNGIQYQNLSAGDFGVNQDGLGNLTGFAYGANIGWVNFESNGAPQVDLLTGKLSGSVYSANCGWISLSNAVAFVQTDSITQGADTDGDGIPDAWERQNFANQLNIATATSDSDGDGFSDLSEYLAGTSPTNAASLLKITSLTRGAPVNNTKLNWNAVATRFYAVQTNSSLSSLVWGDFSASPTLGLNTASFTDTTSTNRFYRIRAFRPLTP